MINREEIEAIVKAEIDKCIPPQPKIFPGDLDEFLRLIVRAKTPADEMKRFRDFLHWKWHNWHQAQAPEPVRENGETPKEFRKRLKLHKERQRENNRELRTLGKKAIQRRVESTVNGLLAKYRDNGIPEVHWQSLAQEYREWWKLQRRAKAAESGKKGVEAKAAKNPLHGESAADD